MPNSVRDRLLREGSAAYRRYISGEILSGHATATAIGLSPSDFFCLNLLALSGPLTAGQLARQTGLTSGATTRLIDRLERGGFVRRDRSQPDRRQVVVEITGDREAEIDAALEPVRRRMGAVFERYDAQQIEVLVDFFEHAADALLAAVQELQSGQGRLTNEEQ